MMEITKPQYESSWKLAVAYSHYWATDVWSLEDWYPGLTSEEIRKKSEEAWKESPGYNMLPDGIMDPCMTNGYVTHTTGTGRTRWEVYHDGSAAVYIFRPEELLVLSAEIEPDGQVTISRCNAEFTRIYYRHIFALGRAVRALVPEWRPEEELLWEAENNEEFRLPTEEIELQLNR